MTTTPCADGNSDDWFIGKDGRQYPDDGFLTDTEVRNITRTVLRLSGETSEEHQIRVDRAIRAARAERRRRALQRRRKARESCYECPLRGECLDLALSDPTPATHGTWGGYYEEELREIRREIERRNRRSGQPRLLD